MIRDLSAIPLEMRIETQRWSIWRYEERDGKPTKVPYRLDGRRAASTNPSDWTGFPEAAAYLLRERDCEGLGFRLGEGWAGVDLDKVRDPATNVIQEWALDVIEMLDSYSEISPSLTGFKIFCRGSLPLGRRRVGGQPDYMGTLTAEIETYDAGRYFTVTGLGVSPGVLGDRTAELTAFHVAYLPQEVERKESPPQVQPASLEDNELISKMLGAKNGSAVWRLWNGDAAAYGSRSEADLALVSHIAFYAGPTPVRIDAIFRQSKLYRDKWDEQHGPETYGAITIAKALSQAREFYRAHRGEVTSLRWAFDVTR